MTSLHLSVSELMEGGLAKLTANLVPLLVFLVAVVLLEWALLWTENNVEIHAALAALVAGLAVSITSSLLILALGGKLGALLRDPEELVTRVVFAAIVSLIVTVCAAVGFIFLIVPGLYLSARWYIAGQLVLLDGTGIFEGLGQSWNMTEASAWPLVGVSIILLVPSILLTFLAGFGLVPVSLEGMPGLALIAQWVATGCLGAFGAAVGVFAWHRLSGQTDELEAIFA